MGAGQWPGAAATLASATWSCNVTGTGADNSTLAFGSDKSRGGRALGLGLGAAVWNDSARAQVWSCLSVDWGV